MDKVERNELKKEIKEYLDVANSYMNWISSEGKQGEEKGNRQWIVENLTMLKKQITDRTGTFLKEIDDTIDKLS